MSRQMLAEADLLVLLARILMGLRGWGGQLPVSTPPDACALVACHSLVDILVIQTLGGG